MSAAEHGHDAVVEMLLERGATVDRAKAVGFVKCDLSPCTIVFLFGCMFAGAGVHELTLHVCPLRCDLQDGSTALRLAAQNGHDAVVKMLLEWGATVDYATTVSFVK